MPNIGELVPGTLEKKGVAYAPRTLSSLVYMEDGSTLEQAMNEIMVDGKRFIMKTSTSQLQVQYNNQRVYDIPVPVERYNFEKFPVVIALNGSIINSTNYVINNNEQIILTEDFALTVNKNDIIMFIFHYLDTVTESGNLDAESINNVRFFVSKTEPRCKQNTDVWFDTSLNQVKQFTGQDWEIIVNGNGGGGFASLKNTMSITRPTQYVDIGISQFDKDDDILFVYQNSVYLEINQDYILEDSNRIKCANGQWCEDNEEQIFNFIVFKNVVKGYQGIDGNLLKNNSVSEDKLATELIQKINSINGSGGVDSVNGSNIIQSENYRLVSDSLIKKWNDYDLTIKALQDKITRYEQLIEQNVLIINK